MSTIQKGTLRRFRLEPTQHGIMVQYILEENPSVIFKGTFSSDNNQMLQLLEKFAQGDDVEFATLEDEDSLLHEVHLKNLSCPMNLKLKQHKIGEFNGVMYADPQETIVMSKASRRYH
jgi:hypothetical protein